MLTVFTIRKNGFDSWEWNNYEVTNTCAYRKIFYESCCIKPNLDCNYPFPVDSAQNGIPFGAKSGISFEFKPFYATWNITTFGWERKCVCNLHDSIRNNEYII